MYASMYVCVCAYADVYMGMCVHVLSCAYVYVHLRCVMLCAWVYVLRMHVCTCALLCVCLCITEITKQTDGWVKKHQPKPSFGTLILIFPINTFFTEEQLNW